MITYILLAADMILTGIIVYMAQKNAKDVVSAYHSGINRKEMPKSVKKPIFSKKKEEPSPEAILLANIDRYDGTPNGQRKL